MKSGSISFDYNFYKSHSIGLTSSSNTIRAETLDQSRFRSIPAHARFYRHNGRQPNFYFDRRGGFQSFLKLLEIILPKINPTFKHTIMKIFTKSNYHQEARLFFNQGQDSPSKTYSHRLFSASISRETPPSWAHRLHPSILHDFDYRASFNQIKGKQDLNSTKQRSSSQITRKGNERKDRLQKLQKQILSNNEVRRTNNQNAATSVNLNGELKKGIGLQKYLPGIGSRVQPTHNQKDIKQIRSDKITGNSLQGFTTKIIQKSSHHLDFSKQPDRPLNLIRRFYNPNLEYHLALNSKTMFTNSLSQIHPFVSYSDRNVFKPKPELDKFYECRNAEQLVWPTRSKSHLDFKKPSPRLPLKSQARGPPASARLNYNVEKAEKAVKAKPNYYYELDKKSPRKIQFSKQVISAKRGCSR